MFIHRPGLSASVHRWGEHPLWGLALSTKMKEAPSRVLVLLTVHELVQGGPSRACAPAARAARRAGKQKWAASGVEALPSGYWYST